VETVQTWGDFGLHVALYEAICAISPCFIRGGGGFPPFLLLGVGLPAKIMPRPACAKGW
jgi:hypothetical protein